MVDPSAKETSLPSTSSAAGSHARTSRSPGRAGGSKASARASGPSTPGSSVRSGRGGSSSRTSRRSALRVASSDAANAVGAEPRPVEIARLVDGTWLPPQTDLLSPLGSAPFCETWPRSGMMLSGTAYELPTLGRPTSATGCGSSPGKLLPTPVSADAKRGTGTYRRGSPTLKGALEVHLRDRELLPTPRSCSGLRSSGSNRTEMSQAVGRSLGSKSLIVLATWMLGFPEAWTSLQPSEPASSSPSPK
ncbi:hypothetical protein BHAOGJBA_2971 [Methylobacterium hispanicum]|uniref:Uncharacterized protein n=1 Tax=Methylobacterium hispanicum TaxID=270350 RepID=A0AAV4ZNE5_9HYPH|nr:hypothetical protein BHAOGJBA_2971 [Methylobacterium hispanicum]